MRIPKLEPVALRIQTRRQEADAWVDAAVSEEAGWIHVIRPTTWPLVPMRLFRVVVLRYCLNYAKDVEDMQSMVSDAMDRVHKGGRVLAVARVCDNGQELAARMVRSGIPPEHLGLSNLSNREIGRLRPSAAVLLTSSSVYRPADSGMVGTETNDYAESARFLEWVTMIRQSPVEPELRFQPERLATRITDIGLTWRK